MPSRWGPSRCSGRTRTRPLAVNFRVGGRFPASCTSSGKAMLSTPTDARVRELMPATGLPCLTRHSVGSVGAVLRQLAGTRRDSYAVDDEETAEGMCCFGAPVYAARRADAAAAVAVSVIKAGLAPRRRAEVVAAIRELARTMSFELGESTGE